MGRIIVIILLVLAIISVIFLYFFPFIKKAIKQKHFRYFMGRKIYKIANDNDYLLLQDFVLKVDSSTTAIFDHILFGNKYFYFISDRSWKGSVIGSNRDDLWLFYNHKNGNTQDIKNPLRINQKRIDCFSLVTGIDKSMLINIVVVSDDCLCSCVGLRSETTFVCKESHLRKLIFELESRNVAPFDAQELENVVYQVSKLNQG